MNEQKRGFKRKTIEQLLRSKINHWLKSIDDEPLRNRVKDHYIVTGGAIASMLMGDMPNDYDIYLDDAVVAADLSMYYVKRIIGANNDPAAEGIDVKVSENNDRVEIKVPSTGYLSYKDAAKDSDNTGKYKVKTITTNAITLSDKIQIVLRFVGEAAEIHKNYDFVHATNYFTEKAGLVLHQKALESILSRELKYVGSLYPVCSIFRIKKFLNRGWTITAGETLKILFDVSKLDLTNLKVLTDQLTGVDTTFFTLMLEKLAAKDESVSRTYLFELINEIFDGEDNEGYEETSEELEESEVNLN